MNIMDASPFFNILTNKTSFLRWAVDSYTTAVRRHSQSSLLELVNLALSIPVEVFPDRFLVDFQSQLMCRKKSSMSFTITFHDLPRSFMLDMVLSEAGRVKPFHRGRASVKGGPLTLPHSSAGHAHSEPGGGSGLLHGGHPRGSQLMAAAVMFGQVEAG